MIPRLNKFLLILLISIGSLAVFSCLLVGCSKDKEEIINPAESQEEEPSTNQENETKEDDPIDYLAKGCPDIEYPEWDDSPYVLPYQIGKTYKVDLSNCSGSFHSEGRPDEFAIDFNMEIGDTITASREGVVVAIEESGMDYEDPNNLVIVDHGDKTYAQYMHLTFRGAKVSVGDTLQKGDLIGLCGATGLAGYPHLHLVISIDDYKWPYKSIPVTFSNTDINERSLKSGLEYHAKPY